MTDSVTELPTTMSVMERALFPEAPPATVGKFEIVRQLGRGGMGVVYLAVDPALKRQVAIKLHGRGTDTRAQQQLLHEAEALARLRHRNVVTVHEVGLTKAGEVFAVMEYLPGLPLDEWARESNPSPEAIPEVVMRCAAGLAAAHDAKLVHGDFKPRNVVLDQDDEPKIIDFGLARGGLGEEEATTLRGEDVDVDAPVVTRNGRIAGTPRYMAPELWRGDPPSPATDQFALGVSLYELLAKRAPFEPRNFDPPPRPPRVRRPVWRVIERALDPEPTRRFDDLHALLDALRTACRPPTTMRWAGTAVLGSAAVAAAVATQSEPVPEPSLVAVPSVAGVEACRVGEDLLASDREWTPSSGVERAGGEFRLTLPPSTPGAKGSDDEFVRTELVNTPAFFDRAIEFEVAAAASRHQTHELQVGLDDGDGIFMTGILVYGGRWVFPLAPAIRGHAQPLGPEDRFFRIQIDDRKDLPDVVSYEMSQDGEHWRPFFRTNLRIEPGRLFVTLGTREPPTVGDTALVRSIRCAEAHEIGKLSLEHDLVYPPVAADD